MVNVNKNDSGNYTCWPSGGALASVLLNVIDGKFNSNSKCFVINIYGNDTNLAQLLFDI